MKKNLAEQLKTDPRIEQAKQLILAVVNEYQQKIHGVRPAEEELKGSYAALLDHFAKGRGAPLWYPYLGSGIGKGVLVELGDGSIKYDLIGGIGVHYFGHSHPKLIEASVDGAITDTVMQGNLQQNVESAALVDKLVSCSGLDHCFLTTSGSMANENGLKIILQKKHPANRILVFERCFAGRTWSLAQMSDKPNLRDQLPINLFVDYVPFYNPAKPKESTDHAVSVLKQHLQRYPKQHACMFFELIQGEAGFYPGSHEFFRRLMETVRDHQIAVFVDEVQTFGRTSSLFAYQYFDLASLIDLVSIGKMSQICATLYRKEYNPRPALISQTFTGSSTAIGVANTILSLLTEGDYLGPSGKNKQIEERFHRQFDELAKKYPTKIRGPWGVGSMVAFTPFDGSYERTKQFGHALFEAGLISFIAGSNPTRIRFLVPGSVEMPQIDAVVNIIEELLCSSSV